MKAVLLHKKFKALPVNDCCEWFGTEWVGEGKEARLKPCGALTIGAGLFCDPNHKFCWYVSVCERHKGTMPFWELEDD